MKFLLLFFTTLLFFSFFQITNADNTIKTGDIDKSDIVIVQGNKLSKRDASDNKIKTDKITGSSISIDQGTHSMARSSTQNSTSLIVHFKKEIITGIITLVFGLLLWFLKYRFGGKNE